MSAVNVEIQRCISRNLESLGDNDAQFIQRVYSDGIDKYINRIKAIDFVNRKHVLDAGCGFGQWSIALASENEHITACDISTTRTHFLSDLSKELSLSNMDIYTNGLDVLPFSDATFDAVFCYGVIFLTPWKQTLKELRRVIKPGGTLYVNANGLGWYLFLWMEEHNKAEDYDPKAKVAKAMQNTLDYEREGIFNSGNDLIIEPDELQNELLKLGFNGINIAGEGCLHLNDLVATPQSFFQNKYYGLPGVFEATAVAFEAENS